VLRSKCGLINLIAIFVSISVAYGFGVTGDLIEDTVPAGGHISHEIIVNTSAVDEPSNFSIEIMGIDMYPDGTMTGIKANKDNNPYSARPFLSISPVSFLLEPGKSQELLLEGDVPSDVGSGTRYAMVEILSKPISSNGSKPEKMSPMAAINAIVIIQISGTDQILTGEISDLKIEKPISTKVQNISLNFENTGNTHFKALVKADLLDEKGEVLASASIPLSRSSIFPGASRLFKFDIRPDEELKPGTYSLNATVNLGDESVLATKEVEFKI
jgi:hypothetical protein